MPTILLLVVCFSLAASSCKSPEPEQWVDSPRDVLNSPPEVPKDSADTKGEATLAPLTPPTAALDVSPPKPSIDPKGVLTSAVAAAAQAARPPEFFVSRTPQATAAVLRTARAALPANVTVYDGGLGQTATGEVWLTIGGAPFMWAPQALIPESLCATMDAHRPAKLWLMPSEPVVVLALGLWADLYVWDPAQECFVEEPGLIIPGPSSRKVLELQADGPKDLKVVEIDLFPDIPGREIVSVGNDCFRVDRGEGEGAIRTGRTGLPITQRSEGEALVPELAPWEQRLRPLPTVDEEPDDSTPTQWMADVDAREVLEEAWDDATPLVSTCLYSPSPEALHPDYSSGDDDDEEVEEPDPWGKEEAYRYDLSVNVVPGGVLFSGSKSHLLEYPGGDHESSDGEEENMDLFRLRDGRVLRVFEEERKDNSSFGSGAQGDGHFSKSTTESQEHLYFAAHLALGDESWKEGTGFRYLDDTHLTLERESEGEETRSDFSRDTGFDDDDDDDDDSCVEGPDSGDEKRTELTADDSWSLAGVLKPEVDFSPEVEGERVELEMEGVTHKPQAPFDTPRKAVKGVLFGRERQRLVADPHGVHLFGNDGSLLADFLLDDCLAEQAPKDLEGATLSVNAEVYATPIAPDLVLLELNQKVEVSSKTFSMTCSQDKEVLLHGPTGRTLEDREAIEVKSREWSVVCE